MNLLSMSKKQSKESNNNELRPLRLSRNVNDYDTGEPIDFNIAGSKKKIGVNKHFQVKIGNKSKTIKRFSAS
jgi:ribosomal protein L21E